MTKSILMVSGDPRVADMHSFAYRKMAAYAQKTERLVVLVPGHARGSLSQGSLTIRVVSGGRIFRLFHLCVAGLREKKVGLVTSQDAILFGLVGYFLSWWHGVPLELQIHTDILSDAYRTYSTLNRVRVTIARFLIPQAHMVRVVSERIYESVLEKCAVDSGRVVVVPVAVHDSIKKELLARDPYSVVVVGRLEREKNVEGIIEAFSLVKDACADAKLVVVGDGTLRRSLELRVEKLGIAEGVAFVGWVNNVREYIASASVFVQLSSFEGYGNTLVEAAMLGTPMVVTDVGVVGYELSQEGLVVVGGRNVQEVAQAILRQFKEPIIPVPPKILTLDETAVRIVGVWQKLLE